MNAGALPVAQLRAGSSPARPGPQRGRLIPRVSRRSAEKPEGTMHLDGCIVPTRAADLHLLAFKQGDDDYYYRGTSLIRNIPPPRTTTGL